MRARLPGTINWRVIANFTLLLVIIGSMAWGISSVITGLDRGFLFMILLVCLGIVLLLSSLHFSNQQASSIIPISGVIGLIFYSAALSEPLGAFLRILSSIPEALIRTHIWPELAPLSFTWSQVTSQLLKLFERTHTWLLALFQGNYYYDAVVISFSWGVILWLVTGWTAWLVFRWKRPVAAITPAGILLSATINFANGNAFILLPFVTATLLLMALNRYEAEEQYWKQNNIDYAEDIRLDMVIVLPLIVLCLTILASFTPSISIRHISRLIRQITSPYQSQVETVAKSFGIDQTSAENTYFTSLRNPGLPQGHLLSSGAELSQHVVMVIQTGELAPAATLEMLSNLPTRYYWRSITYDIYTGHGWATSPTETIKYKGGQQAISKLPSGSTYNRMVTQSVQFSQDGGGILYTAGELIKVDVDYEVSWRQPIEGINDIFGATAQTQQYQAYSIWMLPSIDLLRSSPPTYPDWVRERYLALPDSIPQRVRDLARDLIQEQTTSYDQATAIEAYLRGFPYSLDVPTPPPDMDVADYFLFDLQKGYCDYYATAMVVLSRAAGLPARLVSGYATGTYDPPNARYVVTADNAHSWVEVYFSGIGWVEFEPTGGYPAISRPDNQAELPSPLVESPSKWYFNILRAFSSTWLLWLLGIGALLILSFILPNTYYAWRLHRLSSEHLMMHVYQRLVMHGNRLAINRQTGDTPSEYAQRLTSYFLILASIRYVNTFYKPAPGEIRNLIKIYNQVTFSPHPLSSTAQKQALNDWLKLRWRLITAQVLQRKG